MVAAAGPSQQCILERIQHNDGRSISQNIALLDIPGDNTDQNGGRYPIFWASNWS